MKKVFLLAGLFLAATVLWAAPGPRVGAFRPVPPTPDQFLQAPRDGTRLLLLGAIFDPTVQEPDFTLVGLPGGVDGAYGIVQFDRERLPARDDLQAAGVTFVGYLPDNAYQVRLTTRAHALLAGHEAVRWMGPYKVGYKVHPRLWPGSDETSAEVTVSLFPDAPLDAVRAALAVRVPGAALLPISDLDSRKLRYAVPPALRDAFVAGAAEVSGVSLIEPYRRPVPNNNDAIGPIQSNVASIIAGGVCSTCSIFTHGLTGTGQIAAVADTGNDSDMCFSRYDALPGSVTDAQSPLPPGIGTIDPTHKIIAYYVQPGATAYDGGIFSFHGTHTSGTVTGDNFATPSTPTLPGIDVGDGMAPNAKLVFQDVGHEASGSLAGLASPSNMYLQALNAGARVHSNSYGADTAGAYTGDCAIADRFLFDHEDMTIFFSAGNAGAGGPMTIGSPGNAKNVVTVGALGHGNSTTIAGFSSRGPTADGRKKPDIMAPGSATRSALGDASHTSNNCGTGTLSGTSMSCPTTAGGGALLRQYFEDGYYPTGAANPADAMSARAPLVKAALLNGALPLPAGGVFGGNDYGWGRIFLDNNAFFSGDGRELRVWNVANTDGLQTAGGKTYQVTVGAGQEFRASLVWSDAEASAGAGATLVNNLNLTVNDGTNTYLGNVFDASGNSIPGGTPDVVNNVEQVRLSVPVAASYTITIGAPTVPGNGRAGTDRQGYALVVSYAACATAVTSAPTGLSAVNHAPMGVDLSWTSAPGSTVTQAYRARGTCSAPAKDFQFIGSSTGTTLTDGRAQGGVTYAYKVRGADGCGEGPASTCVTITPTGICNVVPSFDGIVSAVGGAPTGTSCNVRLGWSAGASNCPVGPNLFYNIYRATTHDFTPGPGNLLSSTTGTNYDDTSAATDTTYYYVVRAEDSTTSGPGPHGGNEENNRVELFATALGPPGAAGTFNDGAGDGHAYGTPETPWQITSTQFNSGAFSYHAGPDSSTYPPGVCAALTTPPLSLGTGANLSYFARYNIEYQWDGTVVEISTNGGTSWSNLPPAGGYPTTLSNAGNACGYPTTQGAFSGPPANPGLTPWTQYQTNLAAFAGQTVKIRWRFTSDGGVEFQGFYLDDIQITNVNLPGSCVPAGQPGLSINDVTVTEGNGGTTTAAFTITLTPTATQTVTVNFATADGTATTANNDYVAAGGTATFPPGTSTQPVAVTVNGDTNFEPNETFFVNLSNPVNAPIVDGQGVGTILNDDGGGTGSTFVTELFHGFTEIEDLAPVGGAGNSDYYRLSQKPFSSYEVLVDATSGDIGQTLDVQRIGPDGSTVIQNSASVGLGFSRSLSWINTSANEISDQTIRVRSAGCTTDCGPDDVYMVHAFETTYSIPRFNNSGTQITVILLQNASNRDITGDAHFWDSNGTHINAIPFTLAPKQVLVSNTATVVPGAGGSVTVVHDGRYGDLSGKTVALEPATGFSFDSPMLPRAKVN